LREKEVNLASTRRPTWHQHALLADAMMDKVESWYAVKLGVAFGESPHAGHQDPGAATWMPSRQPALKSVRLYGCGFQTFAACVACWQAHFADAP
jgi:hypothetical protein